jgi:hypothetical protein
MESFVYFPSNGNFSLNSDDTYRYLYISAIWLADTSFPVCLMGEWTDGIFSLHFGNTIDTNRDTIILYSFNSDTGKSYYTLTKLNIWYVYLRWGLNRATHVFICEIKVDENQLYIKEYRLDSIKENAVMSIKSGFNIKFANDDKRDVQTWFKRLWCYIDWNSFELIYWLLIWDNWSEIYFWIFAW